MFKVKINPKGQHGENSQGVAIIIAMNYIKLVHQLLETSASDQILPTRSEVITQYSARSQIDQGAALIIAACCIKLLHQLLETSASDQILPTRSEIIT